jgi:PTH1 family peptidyl-tRNA hydrolase
MTKLIIGLGNPGAKYHTTRHNVGWMILDLLAQRLDLSFTNHSRTQSELASGKGIKLAKPQTFMNNSGLSVAKLIHYFNIPIEDIIVIHDDLDLPVGTIRQRAGGTSGGHNGIQSIIDQLGTKDFARLKIGIGRDQSDPSSYVLRPFSASDKTLLKPALEKAVDLLLKEM